MLLKVNLKIYSQYNTEHALRAVLFIFTNRCNMTAALPERSELVLKIDLM